ncbi:MAG: hypothetical protein Fur0022_37000 [Anaerolineales bacterium]
MKKSSLFIVLMLGLIALTGGMILKNQWAAPRASAAPTVLVGSLQAGCYLITPTSCRLSVEPFTISIADSERLVSFNLTANDQILYDFGASSALNPVIGDYLPSPVALDFAARCGQTYTLNLHALDTGDLDFVTIGETQPITCPKATFRYYLPAITR